jgi:hypothetical protein
MRNVNFESIKRNKMNEVNKEYWASKLPHPLSPSDLDTKLFKNFMSEGSTLLLGCTRKLIPLSNRQLDIDPWYEADTVIVGDWTKNNHYYTNIIIDGGLNLTKKLCDGVVDMASKNCKTFIARTFAQKLDIMRIADHFPQEGDFEIKPSMVVPCGSYNFFIWNF